MDEYFFFLEGSGVYIVDGEEIILTKDSFLRVPAGNYHEIRCTKKKLKFIYSVLLWTIVIDKAKI